MKLSFIFIALILFSCNSVNEVERIEFKKNPTIYVYPKNIDQILSVFKTLYVASTRSNDDPRYETQKTEFLNDVSGNIAITAHNNSFLNFKMILNDYNLSDREIESQFSELKLNEYELLLPKVYSMKDSILDVNLFRVIGYAKHYRFIESHEFPYYNTCFVVNFRAIDDYSTEVKIITVNPALYVGSEFSTWTHSFGTSIAVRKYVEPSTIEEYQILLKIGEALGIKNQMPPLNLPETKN